MKYYPNPNLTKQAYFKSLDDYQSLYEHSLADPEGFWSEMAGRLHWSKKWNQVRKYDFVNGKLSWYEGGKLNACYNCLDRHVEAGHGGKTAIIWEGNDPGESKTYSYADVLAEVQRFANVLKAQGV
ncbi:MAG: acetyl-coenzyme A synthetase, partial [Calditrichaeota bacterium]|nr:acetyl-coenzyme A synthetase [Calditrichota bacterium]